MTTSRKIDSTETTAIDERLYKIVAELMFNFEMGKSTKQLINNIYTLSHNIYIL